MLTKTKLLMFPAITLNASSYSYFITSYMTHKVIFKFREFIDWYSLQLEAYQSPEHS